MDTPADHPLRKWRTVAKISQGALGDATGCKKAQVSRVELGQGGLSVPMLARMAGHLAETITVQADAERAQAVDDLTRRIIADVALHNPEVEL